MLPNYCPFRSITHLYYSPTPFAPGGKLNGEVENTNFGFKHKGKLHVLWRVQHFCPSVLSREHSRKKKAGHAPSASPAKHWLCNLDVVVPAKTAQWCWLCYHLPLLLLLREKLSSLVGKSIKRIIMGICAILSSMIPQFLKEVKHSSAGWMYGREGAETRLFSVSTSRMQHLTVHSICS